ncbi:MAG: D-alanyl-D-alanine carboxypeptidase [Chloroflexi bacterium]|nr:D-alanyl-D-alanine carboxypeptidase [Chloroflexota bacterium]
MRLRTLALLVGTVCLAFLGELALSRADPVPGTPLWSGASPTASSIPLSVNGPAEERLAPGGRSGPLSVDGPTPERQATGGEGSIRIFRGLVSPSATPTQAPSPTSTPALPTPTPTLAGPVKVGQAQPPPISAESAIVVDGESGAVLYERNAHLRLPPASTTKIVTALVALERGDPADRVQVRYDATELVDSTLMGILVGDIVTLEDLLYGLMLPSGNDAALAIANHVAGSKEQFVALMNQKAAELGLPDSHFVNPHGLDADEHYSSAADLVAFARYGMARYPLFVRLSAAKYWEVRGSRSWEIYNLNKLLSLYKGADGVKIGYTDLALRTIVASATRDGHRVFVALLRSRDLWTDTPRLLDYAFSNFRWSG